MSVNKISTNVKQKWGRIILQKAHNHFCLVWQLFIVASSQWRLPVRSPRRLVLLWQRKFESNQSTFVLLHKACLGGYWNLAMILSLKRVCFTFLNRYVNICIFFLSKTNPILYNCHVRVHFWLLILTAAQPWHAQNFYSFDGRLHVFCCPQITIISK